MDRAWKNFTSSPGATEDELIAKDAERADDTQYQNDFVTLVSLFRSEIVAQPSLGQFTMQLQRVRAALLEPMLSSFVTQCFDDHGPGIVLRALARAYEQPTQIVSDVVEFP
jgi:hypothetical protein